MMSSAFFVLAAIDSGVVVIAVAGAVVLVVLLVTVSMRGRQRRGAKQRDAVRRDAGEAREHDRDVAPEGAEDPGPDQEKQGTQES